MKIWPMLYLFLRWCPGGFGIFLRQKLYPYLLGKCGKKVLFGRFVTIENPGKIYVGDHVVINDKVTLDASCFNEQGPAIILGEKAFVGVGCLLRTKGGNGKIVLQSGSSIGSFCVLEAKGNITIGEHALLAAYCTIGSYSAEFKFLLQDKEVVGSPENDIEIGSGCWLGVRSSILPGALVGEGSIVGAHAIVRSKLPCYVVAVGSPAKVIRNRIK